MKKIVFILKIILVSLLVFSCFGEETCTSAYSGWIKIDGRSNDKVSIKYIGPDKREYKKEFRFAPVKVNVPYFKYFDANTICNSKDFKKNKYSFLKIQNLGEEDIIICGVLEGAEISKYPNNMQYRILLRIYAKQDKDPNYDYSKDTEFENVKFDYIDRQEFYEKLFKENYPYIIKLEPQKICIMNWGNLGFKVL